MLSIATAHTAFGVMDYASLLYNHDVFGRGDSLNRPRFEEWFKYIEKTSGLRIDSPEMQIIELNYLNLMARNLAVSRSQALLKRTQNESRFTSQESFLTTLEKEIIILKQNLMFIGVISKFTQEEIGFKKGGYSEEQLQLLTDIAFLDKKEVPNPESLFDPLIKSLGSRDWVETIAHWKYLLKHFPKAFPEWRRPQDVSDSTSTAKLEEIDYIPIGYQDYICKKETGFSVYILREMLENSLEVINRTIAYFIMQENLHHTGALTGLTTLSQITEIAYSKRNDLYNLSPVIVFINSNNKEVRIDFSKAFTQFITTMYKRESIGQKYRVLMEFIAELNKAFYIVRPETTQTKSGDPRNIAFAHYTQALFLLGNLPKLVEPNRFPIINFINSEKSRRYYEKARKS